MNKTLYQVKDYPIFQNVLYRTREEAADCKKGNITLVQDFSTGLIYNADFDEKLMTYDVEYDNEQALSGVFQTHIESAFGVVSRHFSKSDKVIEIGCGKGYFLELLSNRGFDVRGFDPTYQGNNPRVTRAFFEASADIHADCIVMRHVLEHIDRPIRFLSSLYRSSKGGG